jgi:hypothetical protein
MTLTRWCEIDLNRACIPADWPDDAYLIREQHWEDNEEWIIVEVIDPDVTIPEEWLL